MVTEQEFKVGDTVKRINGEHAGMRIGDTDEIIFIDYNSLWLKNFKGKSGEFSHSKENFVIIGKKDVLSNLELW
jgi:hypothetical protein